MEKLSTNKQMALVAWCNMKIAECDKEVAMAKMVNMEKLAEPFARDARFFRAIVDALKARPNQSSGGSV